MTKTDTRGGSADREWIDRLAALGSPRVAGWVKLGSFAVIILSLLLLSLLLPALFRQRGGSWRQMGIAAGLSVLLSGLILWPMLLTHFGETAGLRAYATTWQMNDSLYQGFQLLGSWIAPGDPHRAARAMVGLILLGWIVWLCRHPANGGQALCERALWIVAGLFLLSPTQYPWYWLWMLPMLAVRPSPGLLLLTATLPLYYLRFPMQALGYGGWFHYGVVWVQFGPAFVLLAWEAWQGLRLEPQPPTKNVAAYDC